MLDFWADAVLLMAASATAVAELTTVGLEELGELKPNKSRPPEVQLRFTPPLESCAELEDCMGREVENVLEDCIGGR